MVADIVGEIIKNTCLSKPLNGSVVVLPARSSKVFGGLLRLWCLTKNVEHLFVATKNKRAIGAAKAKAVGHYRIK